MKEALNVGEIDAIRFVQIGGVTVVGHVISDVFDGLTPLRTITLVPSVHIEIICNSTLNRVKGVMCSPL